MGNENSKLNYRKSVIQLTTKTEPVDPNNDEFWDQFWLDYETTVQDIFILMPAAEIRALREESPTNLSTLCTKAVNKIVELSQASCLTTKEQNTVLNCVRVLTRIIPYLFEDGDWVNFFWSTTMKDSTSEESEEKPEEKPLAEFLIFSLCKLLFYPDFTVYPVKKPGPDNPEDSSFVNTCEYIWENGVGFNASPGSNSAQDSHRCELLKLFLTCCSVTMYLSPEISHSSNSSLNRWIECVTSRHGCCHDYTLPLFTSLLNVAFSYDPVGYGMPYNHLMFSDRREPLVEVALQLLCVTLECQSTETKVDIPNNQNRISVSHQSENGEIEGPDNLFVNFLSRIHKDEDFEFLLSGFCRLLNNPLTSTYLPNSMKKIQFHQELLILLWRVCEVNKNFMFHLLKSDQLMDILVPILYHMNNACSDPAKLGVMHIGAFLLLLLSGERNFGVKLNKAYAHKVQMNIPVFTGNHADLLILVFHRIITTGHSGLQPLYDCFLTVIVNISPYLKSLSTATSAKIMHLVEAFSTPWFLLSSPTNHHLIFFLLETLNNIIQYQFDGNSNLVYCMIRKRQVFHSLSGFSTVPDDIAHALSKKSRRTTAIRLAAGTTITKPIVSTPSSSSTISNNQYTSPTSGSPASQRSVSIQSSDAEVSAHLKATLEETPPLQVTIDKTRTDPRDMKKKEDQQSNNIANTVIATKDDEWMPTSEWAQTWKQKLPLQTIMRLLQVLVPQVEKICIDKGLTDESEIIKFLQRGTLVGLLPVPHPLLIRKYQSNPGTDKWFRTYVWGVIYLRNEDPPIWYDTNIQLFEIQRIVLTG